MRVAIHQALTRGSVFPEGDWDAVFWFAGSPRPDSVEPDDGPDPPGGHVIDVPDGWTLDRGEPGDEEAWLVNDATGETLEAFDVFLEGSCRWRGFGYVVDAEAVRCDG